MWTVIDRADVGVVDGADPGDVERPHRWCRWGRWWCCWGDVVVVGVGDGLVGGGFGDGGAGGGFVDDGFVGGVGGDEGLDGEVVDGAGAAAAGVVDEVMASSVNRGSERPASLRWWPM